MHTDFTQLVTGVQKWSQSQVQVEFWSGVFKFENESFHPDLVKTGIQKVEFN